MADGVIKSISAETVRRIFQQQHLKPWRHHLWLSAKVPRDAVFAAQIQETSTLSTRALAPGEVVLSVDEKTHLQPRLRKVSTLPAQAEKPIRLEHEYQRHLSREPVCGFRHAKRSCVCYCRFTQTPGGIHRLFEAAGP